MRRRPYVESDSFWGDVINMLLLRPVYRRPRERQRR